MHPINNQLFNLTYYNTLQPIVQIYHCASPEWGPYDFLNGYQNCNNSDFKCHITSSKDIDYLSHTSKQLNMIDNTISVGIYHRQSCPVSPTSCKPHVNLTLSSLMEAITLFPDQSNDFIVRNQHYDGSITIHPWATIPRVYPEAILNSNDFLPLQNFSTLVKAAAFVSSACHLHDGSNANRAGTIVRLRELGLRIDGLGGCLHSLGPDGVEMKHKDQFGAINHYMFYIAHENSYEPGYVSEKGFNGLRAGTVPIYFGDCIRYRALLPHPRAAILACDYTDLQALVDHIHYLMQNETAYEEHRAWRRDFSYDKYMAHMNKHPLIGKSWLCRTCEWAMHTYYHEPHRLKRHSEMCPN